jgi:hypothetical protein
MHVWDLQDIVAAPALMASLLTLLNHPEDMTTSQKCLSLLIRLVAIPRAKHLLLDMGTVPLLMKWMENGHESLIPDAKALCHCLCQLNAAANSSSSSTTAGAATSSSSSAKASLLSATVVAPDNRPTDTPASLALPAEWHAKSWHFPPLVLQEEEESALYALSVRLKVHDGSTITHALQSLLAMLETGLPAESLLSHPALLEAILMVIKTIDLSEAHATLLMHVLLTLILGWKDNLRCRWDMQLVEAASGGREGRMPSFADANANANANANASPTPVSPLPTPTTYPGQYPPVSGMQTPPVTAALGLSQAVWLVLEATTSLLRHSLWQGRALALCRSLLVLARGPGLDVIDPQMWDQFNASLWQRLEAVIPPAGGVPFNYPGEHVSQSEGMMHSPLWGMLEGLFLSQHLHLSSEKAEAEAEAEAKEGKSESDHAMAGSMLPSTLRVPLTQQLAMLTICRPHLGQALRTLLGEATPSWQAAQQCILRALALDPRPLPHLTSLQAWSAGPLTAQAGRPWQWGATAVDTAHYHPSHIQRLHLLLPLVLLYPTWQETALRSLLVLAPGVLTVYTQGSSPQKENHPLTPYQDRFVRGWEAQWQWWMTANRLPVALNIIADYLEEEEEKEKEEEETEQETEQEQDGSGGCLRLVLLQRPMQDWWCHSLWPAVGEKTTTMAAARIVRVLWPDQQMHLFPLEGRAALCSAFVRSRAWPDIHGQVAGIMGHLLAGLEAFEDRLACFLLVRFGGDPAAAEELENLYISDLFRWLSADDLRTGSFAALSRLLQSASWQTQSETYHLNLQNSLHDSTPLIREEEVEQLLALVRDQRLDDTLRQRGLEQLAEVCGHGPTCAMLLSRSDVLSQALLCLQEIPSSAHAVFHLLYAALQHPQSVSTVLEALEGVPNFLASLASLLWLTPANVSSTSSMLSIAARLTFALVCQRLRCSREELRHLQVPCNYQHHLPVERSREEEDKAAATRQNGLALDQEMSTAGEGSLYPPLISEDALREAAWVLLGQEDVDQGRIPSLHTTVESMAEPILTANSHQAAWTALQSWVCFVSSATDALMASGSALWKICRRFLWTPPANVADYRFQQNLAGELTRLCQFVMECPAVINGKRTEFLSPKHLFALLQESLRQIMALLPKVGGNGDGNTSSPIPVAELELPRQCLIAQCMLLGQLCTIASAQQILWSEEHSLAWSHFLEQSNMMPRLIAAILSHLPEDACAPPSSHLTVLTATSSMVAHKLILVLASLLQVAPLSGSAKTTLGSSVPLAQWHKMAALDLLCSSESPGMLSTRFLRSSLWRILHLAPPAVMPSLLVSEATWRGATSDADTQVRVQCVQVMTAALSHVTADEHGWLAQHLPRIVDSYLGETTPAVLRVAFGDFVGKFLAHRSLVAAITDDIWLLLKEWRFFQVIPVLLRSGRISMAEMRTMAICLYNLWILYPEDTDQWILQAKCWPLLLAALDPRTMAEDAARSAFAFLSRAGSSDPPSLSARLWCANLTLDWCKYARTVLNLSRMALHARVDSPSLADHFLRVTGIISRAVMALRHAPLQDATVSLDVIAARQTLRQDIYALLSSAAAGVHSLREELIQSKAGLTVYLAGLQVDLSASQPLQSRLVAARCLAAVFGSSSSQSERSGSMTGANTSRMVAQGLLSSDSATEWSQQSGLVLDAVWELFLEMHGLIPGDVEASDKENETHGSSFLTSQTAHAAAQFRHKEADRVATVWALRALLAMDDGAKDRFVQMQGVRVLVLRLDTIAELLRLMGQGGESSEASLSTSSANRSGRSIHSTPLGESRHSQNNLSRLSKKTLQGVDEELAARREVLVTETLNILTLLRHTLARHEGAKVSFVACEGPEIVRKYWDVWHRFGSGELEREVLCLLVNLACRSECGRLAICQSSSGRPLLSSLLALISNDIGGKDDAAQQREMHLAAFAVLQNCVLSSASLQAIHKAGFFREAVKRLQPEFTMLHKYRLAYWEVLANAAFTTQGQLILLKTDRLFRTLIAQMNEVKEDELKLILTVLRNLALHHASKAHIAAVPSLVNSLVGCCTASSIEVKSLAAAALWAVAYNHRKARFELKGQAHLKVLAQEEDSVLLSYRSLHPQGFVSGDRLTEWYKTQLVALDPLTSHQESKYLEIAAESFAQLMQLVRTT